ncbi:MAG: hypothetical protein M3Z05_00840 [Gemmatimonadota bacterium]|nr:hypothetical protein [Gemmatimonadota bacterium]
MKALRIAALGFALVIATALSAQAQGGGGGGGGRRGNMLMMGIDSTLSPDQKAKVAEITAKYAPEQLAIRDMMQTDREGAMKKRAELSGKMNPEIRAILSKEQQVIFDANLEAQAKRMATPRPAPAI